MKARTARDVRNRDWVASFEILRMAFKYIARNEHNPVNLRYQAQITLHNLGRCTASTIIKNRCIATGRGRGVLSMFKMCRFQTRLHSMQGLLPGVRKSSW